MGKPRNPTPPPGKPLLFTPDEMSAALRANNGNATATARSLECDRSTVLDYCKRFPEVQDARDEGIEIRVDKAEKALDDSIELREAWAVQLALRGQGAKRGHAERSVTDVTSDGKPIRFSFALDNANANRTEP